eukprot:6979902-Alexandrium_andersonii.AAC.1
MSALQGCVVWPASISNRQQVLMRACAPRRSSLNIVPCSPEALGQSAKALGVTRVSEHHNVKSHSRR